ncbi:hypothetical protein DFH07DRAFT_768596 [Mycena maculata]|uniref:Uncharacterized protein n=1 Tax=Mycena maculata TaxID=230809 RepID=A0AAD7JSF9_9AGAR|nr:hypothetical protein DFH07DRAFT_768596 [Mycena maculata]
MLTFKNLRPLQVFEEQSLQLYPHTRNVPLSNVVTFVEGKNCGGRVVPGGPQQRTRYSGLEPAHELAMKDGQQFKSMYPRQACARGGDLLPGRGGSTCGAFDGTDEGDRVCNARDLGKGNEGRCVWCLWGERPSRLIRTSQAVGERGSEMEDVCMADPVHKGNNMSDEGAPEPPKRGREKKRDLVFITGRATRGGPRVRIYDTQREKNTRVCGGPHGSRVTRQPATQPVPISAAHKLALPELAPKQEPGTSSNVSDAAPDLDADPGPSPEPLRTPPRHRVTVEEVEDESDDSISVEPCQLSPEALAEEGLDNLPWDPSGEILPGETCPPAMTEPAQAGLPPRPEPIQSHATPASSLTSPTYFPHERGFVMPDRPEHRKLPGPVPTNAAVNVGIQKLQDLLHPRCKTGRGHKKTELDLITSARTECMIHFLCLYKASGYTGWTMHLETVATASGKSGSKTWLGQKICEWSIKFCEDSKNLPTHQYSWWHSSILSDKDLAGDIHMLLQSLGKWVSAKDIARYVATPKL